MVKLKSHDLKGIQFHNQRERESKTNPDIDSSNTENNYDLVNESNIDYNKRVKEIIESQKEGTEKNTRSLWFFLCFQLGVALNITIHL